MNILATDTKSIEDGGTELWTDSAGLCRNVNFDPFSAGDAEKDSISFAATRFALPASLTMTRSKRWTSRRAMGPGPYRCHKRVC